MRQGWSRLQAPALLVSPDIDADGQRQKALFEFLGSEFGDHRANHLGVEVPWCWAHANCISSGPDLVLGGCSVLAAPLNRPIRYCELVIVENLLAGDDLVVARRGALAHQRVDPVRDLRRCRNVMSWPRKVA